MQYPDVVAFGYCICYVNRKLFSQNRLLDVALKKENAKKVKKYQKNC